MRKTRKTKQRECPIKVYWTRIRVTRKEDQLVQMTTSINLFKKSNQVTQKSRS